MLEIRERERTQEVSLVTFITTNTGLSPSHCQQYLFIVSLQSWGPNSLFLNKTINLDSEVNWSMQYLTESYCYTIVTSLYNVAVIYKNLYSVLRLLWTGGELYFSLFIPPAAADWHGYLPYTLHGARSTGFISRNIRVVHAHWSRSDPSRYGALCSDHRRGALGGLSSLWPQHQPDVSSWCFTLWAGVEHSALLNTYLYYITDTRPGQARHSEGESDRTLDETDTT